MKPEFKIKCANSARTLEFTNFVGDNFDAALDDPSFQGRIKVYEPGFGAYLSEFFRDLAQEWKGWDGEKIWGSLEGELSLSAVSDSTGHTTLNVVLCEHAGNVWRLECDLVLEAGQLESIAREATRFFEG